MCKSIQRAVSNSIEIKRSEFITYLQPVAFENDVKLALSKIRQLHPQASHHCFAYVLGDQQEIQRFDDDGEPSQTAGMPILDVLKKQNLTNLLCVVVRYYGGIKLGAGGLIRAYAKSTSEALKKAVYLERTRCLRVEVCCDYSTASALESYLKSEGDVEDTIYQETVVFFVTFHSERWDFIKDKLMNMSQGKAQINEHDHFITYQKK